MEETMTTGQAARLLGITVKTLHGCELLVLNQERLSPEPEVVQDLMTIVHCFSSRLYGLRNYRRQLRAALESDHAAGAPDQD
jgi:predicted site-specific integrase-resolvase